MGPKWGPYLAINGNGWKQTANDDLIKSVCYLSLLAVVFRYLPTLLPDTESEVSHNSWPRATSWGPIGDQIAIYGHILTSQDDFHHRSGWEKWEWWETGSAFTIFLFSNDKQERFSTL